MHQSSLNEKGFTAGKKNPGNCYRQEKNPENIFPGMRKIHIFLKNPDTPSPTKQNPSQLPRNPDKSCQNPKFSDVITKEGNSGPFNSL
jgi:hypothetical protein